ncbi:hypothetical protein C5167_046194 [Papaver somniferum]|uniref:Protein SirB1 N-terminal domain-containing protein n=2 Tax=Papaver somniferum TaxID=3469 RepID=A0A4Y7LFU7_PAPSO|nr:hypothetical protein C5167_046194 [Papaver somniferum]
MRLDSQNQFCLVSPNGSLFEDKKYIHKRKSQMSFSVSTVSSSILTSNFLNCRFNNPSSPLILRFVCRSQNVTKNELSFVLHDALDSSGNNTIHAREARENFCAEISGFTEIERQTSICINKRVDLARTALYIAAEDDSLVSHSSVPLPIDSFIQRLDDLSMGFGRTYRTSVRSSPEAFLENLDKYLYSHKGFRRATLSNVADSRALYLNSVLTHRSGSAAMLALIYSEILKMLRLSNLLSFDAEIYFPRDLDSLPRGFDKRKGKTSDLPHILTSQALLVEILRNLKHAFWPFQYDPTMTLFLRAARAAKCTDESDIGEESGFERASAKAAQHRLERGVWTSVRLGDMRRALSACERLILLEHNVDEFRDYSILLYHCGFYEESMNYLKLYQSSRVTSSISEESSLRKETSDVLRDSESIAVEKLMTRLNLILMDEGWTKPSARKSSLGNFSEPW